MKFRTHSVNWNGYFYFMNILLIHEMGVIFWLAKGCYG